VIQYRPATARVGARPLLVVPPQVNLHYLLDLAPDRSLIEYLVGRGVQVFTLVWRNPGPEHGAWAIDLDVAGRRDDHVARARPSPSRSGWRLPVGAARTSSCDRPSGSGRSCR
jgi:hypothetical protein